MKKRVSYEEQSVIVWMELGETYAAAAKRLAALWAKGMHPVQLRANKEE